MQIHESVRTRARELFKRLVNVLYEVETDRLEDVKTEFAGRVLRDLQPGRMVRSIRIH